MKPRIKKLNLSRNEIGDYGSIALFEFLFSPRGRKVELTELNLNQNAIGMAGTVSWHWNQIIHVVSLTFFPYLGLRAISAYIRGNPTLQELNIQNVGGLTRSLG
jgi:Leucine Rich repeat